MMKTMDAYLDEYRFCDLTYLSTLGFSQDDINEVKDLKGISRIEYGYQFDALTMMNNKLSGVKVYTSETYNDEMLNQPILNDGKYPSKSDECLIDVEIAKAGTQIGDKIEISNDQGKKTFEVVGIVKDVRYVAKTDRGTNTLGDGTNLGYIEILNQDNAFFALPKDLYDLRDEKVLYNQISIAVDGASDYNLFSENMMLY
ncbi:MAG: ABC transporter permease [Coprobacillus cateniformis]